MSWFSDLVNMINGRPTTGLEIGNPMNTRQEVSVKLNTLTGELEGLPKEWKKVLDTQLTKGRMSH